MGEWAYYREISPRLLERLVSDPRLVLAIFALGREPNEQRYSHSLDCLPEELRAPAGEMHEMFTRLGELEFFSDERARERWGLALLRSEGFTQADSPTEINIEKRWRRLEAVLDQQPNSDAVQLGYAVTGGRQVGEDLGYGPVRYLTPTEVNRTAKELRELSPEAVRSRLRASSGNDAGFEHVWEALETIRDYYAGTSDKGFGMLLFFG